MKNLSKNGDDLLHRPTKQSMKNSSFRYKYESVDSSMSVRCRIIFRTCIEQHFSMRYA